MSMSVERAQTILDGHNCHRARYNVQPLQWDWNLAQQAQQHAAKCNWGHSAASDRPGQGENLASGCGQDASAVGWFNEEHDWSCGMPIGQDCAPGRVCGHWTQVLWDKTTKVGCAVVDCGCSMGSFPNPPGKYLVCRYSPAGNYSGKQTVQSCNVDNNINCANPSSGNFARPQVPPLPAGTTQQPEQGSVTETTTPPQQQPPKKPIDKPQQQQPTSNNNIDQWDQSAQNDAQDFINQMNKIKQQQQQQQQKGDQLTVNGIDILYAPNQKGAVLALSDEEKASLADRVQNVPPAFHPNIISIFLNDKARQDSNAKVDRKSVV